MKYIEDKDLSFLKNVESSGLNNLVKILTNTKTEELTKRYIYKEFYPEHNHYWEEIASELQYFGGNSIANVFRQKGVVYAEILRDVCKELGIKFNSYLSTEEIEEILLAYEKKEGILEEIKRQAKNIDAKDVAAAIATRFTPLALPTLPILAIKKLSDPAYRITIEAVSEVATLRKKYKSALNKSFKKGNIDINPILKYSDSLIIQDEETNSNLVEIKVLENNIFEETEFQSNDKVNNIKHLVSDLVKGVISTPNQTVELVFSPEVQKGLANKAYKILDNRAIVKNTATGKIKEHATIIQSGQLKQFLTGGYQLLSIAVAQSHLADIEKRLYSIESTLKQISEKLENEDISRIQGSIDYTKSIFVSFKINIEKNELSQSQKNQIEQINKDIFHWKNKLILELNDLIKNINNIKDKDTFGTESIFIDLKEIYNNKLPSITKKYDLLIELNLLHTTLIKFTDPLEIEFTRNNFETEEFQNKFEEILENIEKKKELALKSYFNSGDTINERKKVLTLLKNQTKDNFDYLNINYKNAREKVENKFNNISNGETSIIVSLDENSEIKQYLVKN